MTAGNICFYLQNRRIQTSKTGGQQYSDFPFSIPGSLFVCVYYYLYDSRSLLQLYQHFVYINHRKHSYKAGPLIEPGNTNRRGKLSTVGLLIKVACFGNKQSKGCYIKICLAKLISARRSTVLSLPLR